MSKRIKILYEDSNILAIDKPSGILAHGDGREAPSSLRVGKTILDLFLKKYPKIEIAHRLDKETSGVLLLAKNKKAYEFLKSQFSAPALGLKNKSGLPDRQNRINKTYIAIVNGWVKNDRGVINKPIGRSPKDFRRHLAGRGARGEMREAVTEYKVLKRILLPLDKGEVGRGCEIKFTSPQPRLPIGGQASPYKGEGNKFTYLEIKPKTGRTHQIRVHMKYINHPVACDSLYNPNGACPRGFKRLALHAKSIEFKNLKGEIVKIKSAIPKEFKKLVNLAKLINLPC